MCGIFGLVTAEKSKYAPSFLKNIFINLSLQSESRGKDSSGLCIFESKESSFNIYKGPVSISQLLKNHKVSKSLFDTFNHKKTAKFLIGHARLVTNGTQLNEENNQPVIKNNSIVIHNGIITNSDFIWKSNKDIDKKYEIDTEVILSLYQKYTSHGDNPYNATYKTFNSIEGSASIALVPENLNDLILATNNGSIYTLSNGKDFFIFFFFFKIVKSLYSKLNSKISELVIKKIESNNGILLNYKYFSIQNFNLNQNLDSFKKTEKVKKKKINIQSIKS